MILEVGLGVHVDIENNGDIGEFWDLITSATVEFPLGEEGSWKFDGIVINGSDKDIGATWK